MALGTVWKDQDTPPENMQGVLSMQGMLRIVLAADLGNTMWGDVSEGTHCSSVGRFAGVSSDALSSTLPVEPMGEDRLRESIL